MMDAGTVTFGNIRLDQGLVRRIEGLLSADAETTPREILRRLDGYSSAASVRTVLRFLVATGRARYEGEDGKRRYRRAGDGVEHNALPGR